MTPSRGSAAGRAYLDLQKEARGSGRPVQELFQLYVLEGFLDRLSQSTDRAEFVLKGGMLLAVFDVRRPTRDIDLQAEAMSNEADDALDRIVQIASIEVDDGIDFEPSAAKPQIIRDDDDGYSGVRVSMPAHLDQANLSFYVDVSVGDPIYPEPKEVEVPRLLGGTISVRGYPIELVHAEKIVTAVARGTLNTRWRDFVDVVSLSGQHAVTGDELTASVTAVADHREVELEALEVVLEGYGALAQPKWAAWRNKQGLQDRTPASFEELLAAFNAFAGPAVVGAVAGRTWDPGAQTWI